jgi:large subunit ribosomal protein L13
MAELKELNIDATNAVAGRLASHVAKQALLGFTVNIFNSEKAVMSGNTNTLRLKYYHRIFETGQPFNGPFISRMPDRFLRRIIRGMVEHKEGRGKEAFERIMCYIGVPVDFKDKKLVSVGKKAADLPRLKYQTIGELCVSLGGKV